MISGLLRAFEKFTGQLGFNDPDLVWNALLQVVDWFANVLPVYAGMHVTMGALKFGGPLDVRSHHAQLDHTRHFLGAILCLMISGCCAWPSFSSVRALEV